MLHLALLVSALAAPQDAVPAWPQFRGPGGLALAGETPIPLDFGPDSRVLWKTVVPTGHSSPCVYGDRIFLTGADESALSVLALDRASGAILWKRAFERRREADYGHVASAPAMATPCTDGERVFVYFAAYGLVALDFDGKTVWEKPLPPASYGFGAGGSPVIAAGRVILARDGAPEAAVIAYDAASGEEAWRVPRLGFIESHSTPFVWRTREREEVVIAGTRKLCSFDAQTGEPLWNVVDITLFSCTTATADANTLFFAGWSTPNGSGRPLLEESFGPILQLSDAEVADMGLLFDRLDVDEDGHLTLDEIPACRARDAFTYLDRDDNGTWERHELTGATSSGNAPGKNIAIAVAAGGKGDVTATNVSWSWERGLPYVSSPLLYGGRLWLFKAGGLVTCLDAKSGKPIIDRERLSDRGEYYMSPVGVAGHVLAGSVGGTLFILDATADDLEIVHTAEFEEGLYATPAVVEGKVYVRTPTTLWAFGA